MEFRYPSLDEAYDAAGVVVVIDVLRAFTTSAYALAAGAQEIYLVGTLEEAFEMKKRDPGLLLMGEVGGLPIPGFDFGNSPAQIAAQDLTGKRLVQRTSAGTQGVVRSQEASNLFAASLVCAGATVDTIQQLSPEMVSFVITGSWREDLGEEDLACADYMAGLLRGWHPDPRAAVRRVLASQAAIPFTDPNETDFSSEDLDFATQVDWFNFSMPVIRREGLLIIEGLTN